jgi:hypothetical protein
MLRTDSGLMSKSSKKPARSRYFLAVCFMMVSCSAYSSALEMEAAVPLRRLLTVNDLFGAISQKIELSITTGAGTSDPK